VSPPGSYKHRESSHAAIRHALGDAASMSNALRFGFYTGATGAALRGTYTPLATLQPTAMFALCHGAAGNAELFIEAGEVLGDPGYTAIAEAIGRQGIERYHEPRRPWPSGLTAGGDTPGLMLGLAGIGYFYLRLHDHATPSVLTIVPRV
jgi:hypothetical protein